MASTDDQQQKRWAAVDRYAEHHLLHRTDVPRQRALDDALELARVSGLVSAEVSPLQGEFLAAQCQLINARNVLEIGTLGGYSTIWLAFASPDVNVTTIEIDPKHKEVADQAIAQAGVRARVEMKLGAALDVLPIIREEVRNGRRPALDFVFIDADKQNNLAYFNEAVSMCRSRACIIVDNVVRGGAVMDPDEVERDGRVRGSREVIEAAGVDGRICSTTLIQTVGVKGYDGFMMAVVK